MDNNFDIPGLTTAEIKKLILQCLEDNEVHSIPDIKYYLSQKSSKRFTLGQVSGAISQLATLNLIAKTGRGLYVQGENYRNEMKKLHITETNEAEIRDEGKKNFNEQTEFRRQIKKCLKESAAELEKAAQNINVLELMDLPDEETAFVLEVKRLREQMLKLVEKA